MGGLGLRHSREQNKALLMKIGWGLTTNTDALWTRVIRGKYRCGNDTIPIIDKRRQGSRLWSGIKDVWDSFMNGMEFEQQDASIMARWKHEKSGIFSTKSAYSMLTHMEETEHNDWNKLWKVKAPERCKMHMWLLSQGRLATNSLKQRWGLHVSGDCDDCVGQREDIIHVSRDCLHAREIWYELGISISDHVFWNSTEEDWLKMNIKDKKQVRLSGWNVIFCITCWLLWKRRNERVHDGNTFTVAEALAEIYGVARCMLKSAQWKREPTIITWSNSYSEGSIIETNQFLEVYVDGAYSMSLGLSGCGGVFLDRSGGILEAFTCRVNAKNSLEAELWGLLCGLRRAWNMNTKICRLWTDALEVMELVNTNDFERHESVELIREIKMLLSQSWKVQVGWKSRENNVYADFFAQRAMNMGPGFRLLTREEVVAVLASNGIT